MDRRTQLAQLAVLCWFVTTGSLHIDLLGPLRVTWAGSVRPVPSAALRALLAYLALSEGHREDRQRLAGLLWERMEDNASRRNLRQTLYLAGRTFGDAPVLSYDRKSVSLSPRVTTDIESVIHQAREGARVAPLHVGDALPDRLLAEEPERGTLHEAWLRLQRQNYETRLRDALEEGVQSSEPSRALYAAEALLALDPADERAARCAMQGHYDAGRPARALDVYKRLWVHLGEGYDSEPDPRTQSLVADIKTGKALESAPASSPPIDRIAIALMPAVRVGDAASDSLARLVRAELTTTLLKFRGFRLIDRAVSQEAADYGLDISVGMNNGNFLLITVLTARESGEIIFSERWEGLSENWLITQAAVVQNLAAALSIEVSRARLRGIAQPDFGAGAFDAWLEGNIALESFTSEGLARAECCFRKMIDSAPQSSMGYSSLARLKNGEHLMVPGMLRRDSVHLEARELANRAVSLDPLDSRAHLHRAWAACLLGDYEQAGAGFAVARVCNPGDPWTLLSSALGEAFTGFTGKAVELSEHVIGQGWSVPPFHWGFHGPIRFLAGDLAGCVDAAETCGATVPNMAGWRAVALWHLGEREEAKRAWADFGKLVFPGWQGAPPDDAALREWFLSLFPIKSRAQRDLLADATAQMHCAQQ